MKYEYNDIGEIIHTISKTTDSVTMATHAVGSDKFNEIIESGFDIADYIEPSKTLDELKKLALDTIDKIVKSECRKPSNKTYFSDLNSAARHISADVQPDSDIRDRAILLLKWDVAIDAYCDDVLFSIKQGDDAPELSDFIAGLPSL